MTRIRKIQLFTHMPKIPNLQDYSKLSRDSEAISQIQTVFQKSKQGIAPKTRLEDIIAIDRILNEKN